MSATYRAAWVFSLARSGSSVTAYAAAAPWNHAVADEPFGPWDRSSPPYNYPASQPALKHDFFHAGERLTKSVVDLADSLLSDIANNFGGRTGTVVIKHPHTMIEPADWQRAFGSRGHWRILLIRNPLNRLNSMLWRKQHGAVGPNWDLATFQTFARRWLEAPERERAVYEQLRVDPNLFFRRAFEAWDWPAAPEHIDTAVAYARSKYHDASAHVFTKANPTLGVVSEKQRALPQAAIDAYLADPLFNELASMLAWPKHYEPGAAP